MFMAVHVLSQKYLSQVCQIIELSIMAAVRGNGMYYPDSSFNMGTWRTVKRCLIELFVQTEL